MKKTLIVVAAWLLAVVLIAALVVSMGFSFPEALLIGMLFLPGALAARFFLPKISFEPRRAGIRDSIFVLLGILVAGADRVGQLLYPSPSQDLPMGL